MFLVAKHKQNVLTLGGIWKLESLAFGSVMISQSPFASLLNLCGRDGGFLSSFSDAPGSLSGLGGKIMLKDNGGVAKGPKTPRMVRLDKAVRLSSNVEMTFDMIVGSMFSRRFSRAKVTRLLLRTRCAKDESVS